MTLRSYRKQRRPGNRAMTKEEEDHVARVKRSGCLCCLALGFDHDPDGPMVEAHHLLEGGIRRGHLFTIGLCLWHHRGRRYVTDEHGSLRSHAWHRENLGPALEEGSDPFHESWGSDDDLLAEQHRLLGV